jgi:hypothetical protein
MDNVLQQEPSDRIAAARQIEQRLSELKAIAIEEGVAPSETSERDLRRFMESHAITRGPYLFLLENGNFRALWKNDRDEQVGLQFLGSSEVQYVIFARRANLETIVRSSGRDNVKGIERLIDAHDLRALIGA